MDGLGNAAEIGTHQRDLCHVHGHIGSLSHGNAHISGCQSLRVVDAIAHHRHPMTFVLQTAHQVFFVLRFYIALVVTDTRLLRPIAGSFVVVATHHVDLYPTLLQLQHSLTGIGFQCLTLLQGQLTGTGEVDIAIRDGQGTGFVDHYSIYRPHILKRRGVFDEDILFCCLTDAHHQGRGSGETHGTRTCDDQYGNGREYGLRQHGIATNNPPNKKRQQRQSQYTRHKNHGDAVDDPLHRSL